MKNKLAITLAALGIAACAMFLGWKYNSEEGLRFVKQLGAGINIGNSLDVYGIRERLPDANAEKYETAWHNPQITPELFEAIFKKGFKTVRIPVSWGEHLQEDGTIEEQWLERVAQVVHQALDAGLYVIINSHHEEWIVPTEREETEVTAQLCGIWRQIAERFADCDERLLFETMNEPRLRGNQMEWTSGSTEMRAVVNRLNAAAVKAIRECGENNQRRWLLLPAYGTSQRETALGAMEIPDDRRIIVSVHAYLPYDFTLNDYGTTQWSADKRDDTKGIDKMAERLKRLFIKKKVPVVITEFSCHNKGNKKEILEWAKYYTQAVNSLGIPCVWWDNGKNSVIIDRNSYSWTQPQLVDILLKSASQM